MKSALKLLFTSLLILGCGKSPEAPVPGVTRTYFIAAEEVDWDYAPGGEDLLADPPASFETYPIVPGSPGIFTRQVVFGAFSPGAPNRTSAAEETQIGRIYEKTLYVEYTDATFTTRKPVAPEWQHLGALGPVIRAQVADTIEVVFKNKTSSNRSYTMHPHGVFYDKSSEGAPYNDGTSGADKADDAVAPGATHTYVWPVPERAGPASMDGPSVMWMYHSHVDEPKDENTGLIGPMIVYANGLLRPDGTVNGIDRELVMLFKVYDENNSHYLEENISRFTGVTAADDLLLAEAGMEEHNLKHTINGYLYGTMPLSSVTVKQGEKVRWYVMAMGTEVDLHTPHWHGQTVTIGMMRTDVSSLLPAEMVTADMVPDNPGTWLFHCHVNDHISAGMMSRFVIAP